MHMNMDVLNCVYVVCRALCVEIFFSASQQCALSTSDAFIRMTRYGIFVDNNLVYFRQC